MEGYPLLFLAFAAGVASFLTPCIIPLVPAYLGYISALPYQELKEEPKQKPRVFLSTLLFILGLALVFSLLGASATVFGQFLSQNRTFFERIAGGAIIAFGLTQLGILPNPFAFLNINFFLPSRLRKGVFTPFLIGTLYAFAILPCAGPVVGSVYLLASQTATVFYGMLLLFVYAMGLGLPFLGAGLVLERFEVFSKRLRRYLPAIKRISGSVLILLGILLATGNILRLVEITTRLLGKGLTF